MDREACGAAVPGVAKSWTWLNDWTDHKWTYGKSSFLKLTRILTCRTKKTTLIVLGYYVEIPTIATFVDFAWLRGSKVIIHSSKIPDCKIFF